MAITLKQYATYGLMTWFCQIIPTLFPFMVIQNLLLLTGKYKLIIKPILPITRHIFKIRDPLSYPILVGFLFGFPLGAKTVCEMHLNKQISHLEAEYLLAFVNNLSPAYIIGFFYPFVKAKFPLSIFCIYMFAFPLFYGLILRYSFYIKVPFENETQKKEKTERPLHFYDALDLSLNNAISGITLMGSYMILFQLPIFFISRLFPPYLTTIIHMLVEISGGLKQYYINVPPTKPTSFYYFLPMIAITFNGLCCLFQTTHYLTKYKLSVKKYMLHKIVLCSILCITLLCIYH